MPNIVRNLRLNRIDLVDAPANPGARVMLVKRDDKHPTASGAEGKWYAGTDGISFPISTAQDVSNAARALGRTHQDREKVKANIIRIARAHGLESGLPEAWKQTHKSAGPSIGSTHVNSPSRRKVVKRQDIVKFAKGLMSLVKGETQTDTSDLEKQSATLAKTIEGYGDISKLGADHPVHELILMKKDMDSQIAYAANEPDDDSDDESNEDEKDKKQMKAVEKRAQEIVKAETAELRKSLAAAEAKAAAAETLAKAHQEASDIAVVTTELRKFDCLTLDMDKQVPLFKSLKATNPELYKSTLESLAAANEVAKVGKSLEQTIGTTRAGGSGPTAWKEIEKLAGDLVSKSGEGLTKAKAIEMVMKDRTDLVKRYYDEETQVIAG